MLDELIKNHYENCDNYKVVDTSDSKKCIIYCSSNGLWDYSEESFRREIIERDKYEWENLDQHEALNDYGRKIFIRDIQLHFYVDGINQNVNSIDEIITLLHSLTEGYEITTIGYSAGGYLAIILGCMLKADKVFSFGGQFNVEKWGGRKTIYLSVILAFSIDARMTRNTINGTI